MNIRLRKTWKSKAALHEKKEGKNTKVSLILFFQKDKIALIFTGVRCQTFHSFFQVHIILDNKLLADHVIIVTQKNVLLKKVFYKI